MSCPATTNKADEFGSIGLGSMMMGWRVSCRDAEKIFVLANETGISLIDTSVSYARGDCHRIIAKCLKNLNLRNEFRIATKVGGISSDTDPSYLRGLSKLNIIRQCELSLNQLNVDSLDVLQLHYPVQDELFDEILEALHLLMTSGKILNYGLCNHSKEDLVRFLGYVKTSNFPGPLSNQFQFNLLNARGQNELFDLMAAEGLKSITWGGLASGLLSEWYVKNDSLKPGSRVITGRERDASLLLLSQANTKKILKQLSKIASDLNVPVQVIALYWILVKQTNNCLLLGVSSVFQLSQLITGFLKCQNNLTFSELDNLTNI